MKAGTRLRVWAGIAAVAALQTAVLAWMVWDRVALLRSGREIVLDVAPVDPRSLFRGDYVILAYDISRIETALLGERKPRGTSVFVTIERGEANKWKAIAATPRMPLLPPSQDGPRVVLKGRLDSGWGGAQQAVRYGIESYFVPEGAGRELERMVSERRLSAVIAVDAEGNAAIKGLMADGQLVYQESLF